MAILYHNANGFFDVHMSPVLYKHCLMQPRIITHGKSIIHFSPCLQVVLSNTPDVGTLDDVHMHVHGVYRLYGCRGRFTQIYHVFSLLGPCLVVTTCSNLNDPKQSQIVLGHLGG